MIDPDYQDMLDGHQHALTEWAKAEAKLARITCALEAHPGDLMVSKDVLRNIIAPDQSSLVSRVQAGGHA